MATISKLKVYENNDWETYDFSAYFSNIYRMNTSSANTVVGFKSTEKNLSTYNITTSIVNNSNQIPSSKAVYDQFISASGQYLNKLYPKVYELRITVPQVDTAANNGTWPGHIDLITSGSAFNYIPSNYVPVAISGWYFLTPQSGTTGMVSGLNCYSMGLIHQDGVSGRPNGLNRITFGFKNNYSGTVSGQILSIRVLCFPVRTESGQGWIDPDYSVIGSNS